MLFPESAVRQGAGFKFRFVPLFRTNKLMRLRKAFIGFTDGSQEVLGVGRVLMSDMTPAPGNCELRNDCL